MPKRVLIVANEFIANADAAAPDALATFGLPTTVILVDAEGRVVGHGPG